MYLRRNMKTIEGKKGYFFVVFLSKWGYFEGNVFFFSTLCRLLSFLRKVIFFPPIEASSRAVCALCPPTLSDLMGWPSGLEGTVTLALEVQLLTG